MTDQPFKLKKQYHKSASISEKKTGFLELFNFCATKPSPTSVTSSKTFPFRPTFSIDINKPPTKSVLTNDTESALSRNHSASKPRKKNYPSDKVFILGENHKIVAKITAKKISNCSPLQFTSFGQHFQEIMKGKTFEENSQKSEIPTAIKKEIFSMYDKGIKATEWHEITPENVAVHIAKRLHCNIMIDALCGFGGNTIQFAKYCDYVLSIDIDGEKTLSARHNAQIYGVDNKIDFITVDFLKLKNLMGDVVFLGPSDTRKSQNESFSIFMHAEPDLRNLLAKSLEISYCIALKLPGDTDLDELAELFNVSLEKYGLYSKRFCIEIEKILDSTDETECIVVYFGDCSTIDLKEEYEAIYEYIASKEKENWKQNYPFQVVVTILHHIGIRRFFAEITKIEETLINKDNFTDSLFEFFLEQLVNKNIFTKTSLKKLIDEESHSTKSQSLLLTRRKSIATSDPFQKNVSSLSSLIKLDLTQNKKSSIDAVKSEPLKTNKPVFKFNERLDKDLKGDLTEKSIEGSPRKTIEGGLNADLENMKNSNDLSELAVSSYSVSSDYFKDFSEDSSPNKENIKINELSEPSFDGLEKSESLPKESGSNHSSRLRSLRVFKRGTSQPARRLRCEGNRRKVCKSPESGFKELLKL